MTPHDQRRAHRIAGEIYGRLCERERNGAELGLAVIPRGFTYYRRWRDGGELYVAEYVITADELVLTNMSAAYYADEILEQWGLAR